MAGGQDGKLHPGSRDEGAVGVVGQERGAAADVLDMKSRSRGSDRSAAGPREPSGRGREEHPRRTRERPRRRVPARRRRPMPRPATPAPGADRRRAPSPGGWVPPAARRPSFQILRFRSLCPAGLVRACHLENCPKEGRFRPGPEHRRAGLPHRDLRSHRFDHGERNRRTPGRHGRDPGTPGPAPPRSTRGGSLPRTGRPDWPPVRSTVKWGW